jgi:hypothetical protein
MIFAMVFTISCSGDDGKNGRNGKNCTVDKDSDGKFEISCDGQPVGSFEDGRQGADGAKGAQGDKGQTGAVGKNGDNCWLGSVGGSYTIFCGEGNGEAKGSLDGCEILQITDYEVSIKCGGTAVNLCSQKVFDASKEICSNEGVIEGADVEPSICSDDAGLYEAKYDSRTQYCGYASAADFKILKPSVLKLCGKDGKPNEDSWENEYCKYKDPKTAEVSNDTCGRAKLNENSWKGEYCGYASATATTKSVIKGVCGDYGTGPNEDAFGKGYCMANRKDETKYVEVTCGTGKPNDGKWKGEYCGFATASNTTLKMYAGACDDDDADNLPTGPNYLGFGEGYCLANRDGDTKYTEDSFCDSDAKTGKPNEYSWKGEYCGFATAAAEEAGTKTVQSNICDDDNGPNEAGYNDGYCRANKTGKTALDTDFCDDDQKKLKPNEGSWKGEYCGYASQAAQDNDIKTVLKNACDDGKGPNEDEFNGGYCIWPSKNSTGTIYTADAFCDNDKKTGKPNEGSWKGQYCGYASKDAEDKGVLSVQSNVCDSGEGPNQSGYAACYCEWVEETSTGTECTTHWCVNGNTKAMVNQTTWKGQYCFADNKVATCLAGNQPVSPLQASTATNRCNLPGTTLSSSSAGGSGSSSSGGASSSSSDPGSEEINLSDLEEYCEDTLDGSWDEPSKVCTVDGGTEINLSDLEEYCGDTLDGSWDEPSKVCTVES